MSDTMGKSIARVGDKVTCPKRGHGGTTVIVSGDPTFIVDGRPVARHGDKTACGATLLASQVVTFVDEAMPAAVRASATDGPLRFEWDEQVRLTVVGDTALMTGLPWFVRTQDGRTLSGRLGPDGQLPRIDSLPESEYEVFWGDEALELLQGAV